MKIKLNKKQKEAISSFFMSLSVAWFIGLFVVPRLSLEFDILTFAKYVVNMIGTFVLGLLFLKEEK